MGVLATTNEFKAYLMRRRRELTIAGEWSEDPAENARRLEADLMAMMQENNLMKTCWVATKVRAEMKDFFKVITRDRECPACGGKYYGDPAVSRRDGRELCPLCGLREALEDAGVSAEQASETITKLGS